MPTPIITDLMNYLDQSVTSFHAVITSEKKLIAKGFQKLNEPDQWHLKTNGKYYVIRGESGLIAWQMGDGSETGVRLIGAHTDSPGLHLKPNTQYSKHGYIQLGVEVYGGMLLASWTDRDLSLAGRVILKDTSQLRTVPFRSNKVLLRIPQLAIHLNREVNEKGLLLNKQQHMPPIFALDNISGDPIDSNLIEILIAEELGVTSDSIANWQLECYDTQSTQLSGFNQEFLVSGRIDNLTMCHAALETLVGEAYTSPQTSMIALFDNEEIGSSTLNGASSAFIRDIIHRVVDTIDIKHALQRGLAKSICISADGAHAVHPNYGEYHDPQHAVKMNRGPVIKINANHRYATSARTAAMFQQLAADIDVPVQKYIHKTDLPCGSTIGPITESGLGIPVVDAGNAMLSMHSIRETAGVADHEMMVGIMQRFFTKTDIYSA